MKKYPEHIYYDNFDDWMVLEKDEFAPPERYMLVYPIDGDCVIETWDIDYGKQISVMHPADEEPHRYRERVLSDNSLTYADLRRMVRWGLPKELYQRKCDRCGLVEEIE